MAALESQRHAAREIRVQYYALLREQAGRSDETLSTARAHTARAVRRTAPRSIRSRCPPEMLRVAVNAEFGDWSQPLAAGDAVVFIPPVAGG